jgi:amino-acid N-acetyltransferase
VIRDARLDDAPAIRDLINTHAELQKMLFRSLADLYAAIRDFKVYEHDGQVVGCCALEIVWSDLAEIKSLSVADGMQGQGVGKALVRAAIDEAGELHLPQVFCLTLEQSFFEKLGFEKVPMDTLPMKVWSDCVRCSKQDNCDEIAMMLKLDR